MNNFGHTMISSGTAWFGIGVIDWIDPPVWTDFAIAGAMLLLGIAICKLFKNTPTAA
jgi:hypothetical protein